MTAPLQFEVYWSMRSPYCYLALDRLLAIRQRWAVEIHVRTVYPVAIRNPGFFKTASPHYRPYHLRDSQRIAEFLKIPYRRPVPDPIIQDMSTNTIAAEQPYIRRLTHLAAAAEEQGKALEFQDRVMRLIWNGETDGWHEAPHLADAITAAGLDAKSMEHSIEARPDHFEAIIERNQEAQTAAGHGGVPLFVVDGEPFFGQDRLDMLLWRLRQRGLVERSAAK
ncbi:MAG: DsbA family protein [Pseudomonadota bacterium]